MGNSWDSMPLDVRRMQSQATAQAYSLANHADGDDRAVRREFSAWLQGLVAGELAHLPESRREHLASVAQTCLETCLRWRAARDLVVMLGNLIRVGRSR